MLTKVFRNRVSLHLYLFSSSLGKECDTQSERVGMQMRQNVNKGKNITHHLLHLIKCFNLIIEKSHKPISYLNVCLNNLKIS